MSIRNSSARCSVFVLALVGPLLSTWDRGAVERARSGAAQRLEGAECRKLLTDFVDADGRTLEANLEPFGLSPAEYLDRIAFREGGAVAHCAKATVVMATAPGLPTVYACPAADAPGTRFAQIQARRPDLAEYMLIHEMLHTLGLGENPPSTFEITQRVIERCQ